MVKILRYRRCIIKTQTAPSSNTYKYLGVSSLWKMISPALKRFRDRLRLQLLRPPPVSSDPEYASASWLHLLSLLLCGKCIAYFITKRRYRVYFIIAVLLYAYRAIRYPCHAVHAGNKIGITFMMKGDIHTMVFGIDRRLSTMCFSGWNGYCSIAFLQHLPAAGREAHWGRDCTLGFPT